MSAPEHTNSSPKLIGLTGNIGSGKSTVSKLFLAKHAALIDSDQIAREATSCQDVLNEIAQKLGADLIEDNVLNREKTAALVFNNKDALATLNSIIHPWVRQETQRKTQAYLNQATPPQVIIFDIPLLYENNLEETVDAVIVINAPLDLRIERVKERSGLSEEDIKARDKAQLPLEEKVSKADYVIQNDSSLEELEQQVDDLWEQLSGS